MPFRVCLLAIVALLAALLRPPAAPRALDGTLAFARAQVVAGGPGLRAEPGGRALERPAAHDRAASGERSGAGAGPQPLALTAPARRAAPPDGPAFRVDASPHRPLLLPAPALADGRRAIRATRPRAHVPRMGDDEPPRA